MANARANWDHEVTKLFLDLCIAEKDKLNFNYRKGPTKEGWKNIKKNFRQQTGRAYNSKMLQNKFHSLKRLYKTWRKLKNASGGGWDSQTGRITMDDEWWDSQVAEDQEAKQFRRRPLAHEHELSVLFGRMNTEEGTLFCVGGTGGETPSGGSDGYYTPVSDDNVGRSNVGRASERGGREQVVDSPPPKRTKSMEDYVRSISESMLERSRNESGAMQREQDEVTQLLKVVQQDGVPKGSELYFIATELFRSASRRASFRLFDDPDERKAWLRWTWENVKKK